MIKKDSVKKNIIYQSVYQILLVLLPLVTSPYISRVLGAEGVGVYSYTNSIIYFFLMAANLGIVNYGGRTIAALSHKPEEMSRAFWGIYFCHGTITVLVTAAYFLSLFFSDSKYVDVSFCQSFQLLAALFDITWFFTGIQRFKVTVIRNIIVRLITVVLIFVLVKERGDVWKYILLLSVGNFIGQAAVWSQLKAYIRFVKVPFKEIFSHLKPMFILFIPVVAMSVYKYMDKLMLPNLSTMSELGFYENSEKIMTIPLGLITSLGVVMLPKMASLISTGNRKQSIGLLATSMRFSLCLAFAMTFGLIGIAPTFAPIFFGEEFTVCGQLIAYIAVTILFMTWANTIRTQYLIPNHKDKAFIVSVIVGSVVNLSVNLLLIPRLGAAGAIAGTVLAEASVAALHTFYSYKELEIKKYLKQSVFFLIPGVLMAVVIRGIAAVMGQSILSLIVQVGVGGALYLILSFLYLYLSKDPVVRAFLKKILKK